VLAKEGKREARDPRREISAERGKARLLGKKGEKRRRYDTRDRRRRYI
jgi:hypothetical protein